MAQNVVGTFATMADAESAAQALRELGFTDAELTVVPHTEDAHEAEAAAALAQSAAATAELEGRHVPEAVAEVAAHGPKREGGYIIVRAASDEMATRASEIMERFQAVDLESRSQEYSSGEWSHIDEATLHPEGAPGPTSGGAAEPLNAGVDTAAAAPQPAITGENADAITNPALGDTDAPAFSTSSDTDANASTASIDTQATTFLAPGDTDAASFSTPGTADLTTSDAFGDASGLNVAVLPENTRSSTAAAPDMPADLSIDETAQAWSSAPAAAPNSWSSSAGLGQANEQSGAVRWLALAQRPAVIFLIGVAVGYALAQFFNQEQDA